MHNKCNLYFSNILKYKFSYLNIYFFLLNNKFSTLHKKSFLIDHKYILYIISIYETDCVFGGYVIVIIF